MGLFFLRACTSWIEISGTKLTIASFGKKTNLNLVQLRELKTSTVGGFPAAVQLTFDNRTFGISLDQYDSHDVEKLLLSLAKYVR